MKRERDYCGVCEQNCLNPAGYRIGSGSCDNPDPPRTSYCCPECGVIVCRACRVGALCIDCHERKVDHP